MGIGPLEALVVGAIALLLVWLRLRQWPRGPGPFVFGFGTVPVDEPPPPREPNPKLPSP